MSPQHTRRTLLLGASLSLALAACGHPAVPPTGGSKSRGVTLILDWYPNADHAGIYGAVSQGEFANAGLAVSVQTGATTTDQIPLVAAGKVDFAVTYEPDLLLARAQGTPVQAVFALVQQPLNCLIALRSSGITHPAQLQGKKVGTSGTPGDTAILNSVVRADGGDPAKVTNINVGFNLVQALLGGKVDAIAGGYWNWEAVQIALEGQPVNVMRLNAWGVPDYDELVLIASEGTVQKDPGLIQAFDAALASGTRYAAAHPDAALQALLTANPSLSRPLVQQSLKDLTPAWNASGKGYGYMDPTQWTAYAAWMRSEKWLTQAVDAGKAMTDAFLPPA